MGKARAFLDYFGLNYDVIEVNSVLRKQVKWSTYKKVPILVAELPDGRCLQLNDSSMITSAMFSYLLDRSRTSPSVTGGLIDVVRCYPKVEFMAEGKRQSVDTDFVHKLSPNVYRTPSEALAAFQWFDTAGDWANHFSTWERYLVIYVGAAAMWLIGKRLKYKYD